MVNVSPRRKKPTVSIDRIPPGDRNFLSVVEFAIRNAEVQPPVQKEETQGQT